MHCLTSVDIGARSTLTSLRSQTHRNGSMTPAQIGRELGMSGRAVRSTIGNESAVLLPQDARDLGAARGGSGPQSWRSQPGRSGPPDAPQRTAGWAFGRWRARTGNAGGRRVGFNRPGGGRDHPYVQPARRLRAATIGDHRRIPGAGSGCAAVRGPGWMALARRPWTPHRPFISNDGWLQIGHRVSVY
jgi:hypothetical protein